MNKANIIKTRFKPIVWLLIVLQAFIMDAFAQHPYYYKLDENDGFPTKVVYELYQDSRGYIWIGANNGLYRYDGNSIVQLKSENENSGSVSSIFEDYKGRIWVRNFRGQIFHTEGDKLKLFINMSDSIRDFPSIVINNKKTLWISSTSGITKYDLETEKSHFFRIKDGTGQYREFRIPIFKEQTSNTVVFMNSSRSAGLIQGDSIIYFNNMQELVENYNAQYLNRNFSFNGRSYIYDMNNTLYEIRSDTLQFVKDISAIGIPFNAVLWIEQLSGKRLAVGTRNGFYLLDETFEPIYQRPFLTGRRISSVFEDKEGSIWVSTLYNGIYVIPDIDIQIFNSDNFIFPTNGVNSISVGRDEIYIGFSLGDVGIFNSNKQYKTVFNSTLHAEIPCISFSEKHDICFFVQWSYMGKINDNKTMISEEYNLSAVKELKIYGNSIIMPINNGVQWYAGFNEAELIKKIDALPDKTDKYRNTLFPEFNTDSIYQMRFKSDQKARTTLIDTINFRLWAGFTDGLFYFKDKKATELKYNQDRIYATRLEMDQSGILWIATSSHGLLAVNNTRFIYRYPLQNPVLAMFVDEQFVWFSTIDGLFKLELSTKKIELINKYDGVASNDIRDIEIMNDRVYLATPEGLVSFDKNKNFTNSIAPGIKIEGFAVWERDTVLKDSYILPYYENNVSIRFKGISLKSRGSYTVQYRMLNLNNKWITVPGYSNIARFPSLPAGDYIFQAKAMNEDGVASEETAEVSIRINPPFWQTWWFFLLFTLLGSTSTILFFRSRLRRVKKRNELEKQLKMSEITAIKAQMNPHFIFNALNSIQDLILQQEVRTSNVYLGMFSDLLRLVLEVSGEDFVSLDKEKEILQLYLDLEKLRFEEEFNFSIDTTEVHSDPEHLLLPSMIIQPYVENAVKHGLLHKAGEKLVEVNFKEENNRLTCTIRDNGIGRVKSGEINTRRNKYHKSFASKANRQRIDLLNDLYDEHIEFRVDDLYENELAMGTCVFISFPIRFI